MGTFLFRAMYYILIVLVVGCSKNNPTAAPPVTPGSPTPSNPEESVFTETSKAVDALDELYGRQVDFSSLDGNVPPGNTSTESGWKTMADFSESFPSDHSSLNIVQQTGWPYESWALNWETSYNYIRDLNLFILKDSLSVSLTESERKTYKAEARFLRANFYFEMVKRMGGVPLVLSNTSKTERKDLELKRARESEVYDFIISEAEGIKNDLPNDGYKSRASKAAALSMESRAALYAGSIAKYGSGTPEVSLPGGEVGISASLASNYYSIALRASSEIISAGAYSLYVTASGPDPSNNYAQLFIDKFSPETIFTKDVRVGDYLQLFTVENQPFSISEEAGTGGRLNPSLNLAECYEKLDNSFAPLAATDRAGNPINYGNMQDIFAGRDVRFAGTFLWPGRKFKSGTVDIWAGYQFANGAIITSDRADHLKPLSPGTAPVQVVGNDGPVDGLEMRTQTGFYLRKYLDIAGGSGRKSQGSRMAFIRYRYAEVLLNAAEAAFELGQPDVAAKYMNQVRARAGLINPLATTDLTFDRVVHERRVELCFEGHLLYDMKRWRLATTVWDGQPTTVSDLRTNPGSARKRSTQPWGLWPYKIYDPGGLLHGRWVFRETLPSSVTGMNLFRAGNYYSAIPETVIAANPLIVRQPNQ